MEAEHLGSDAFREEGNKALILEAINQVSAEPTPGDK